MALLDQTKRAWLNRYYPKDPTSKKCEFCGEILPKNPYVDFLLNEFCDKQCFLITKHFRDPQVFEIQRKIDRPNRYRFDKNTTRRGT